MLVRFRHLFGWRAGVFRSRADLILENLALRQQLLALHAQRPRPRLGSLDRLFWVTLRRLWSGWRKPLVVVTPETVVRWHRTGFRWYWAWRSRAPRRAGRKAVSQEVRHLIFRMVAENRTWGAPRIHGELLMLGFDISERSVSRWMKRAPRNPDLAKRWLVFLRNHREAIAAMDFRLGTSSPLHSRSLSHRGCGQDLPLPDNISVSGLCESTSPLAVKRQS